MLSVEGARVQEVIPLGALVLGTLFAGTPHYGATLLRVYERAEDRRRYSFFAVWVSLAIALLFVAGLHDRELRAKEGKPREARRAFERSLELRPTARTWIALGDLHAGHGRPRAAAAAYDSALGLAPRSVMAH